MPIDSSTSTPIDVGANYPVQFQVDPKVMDMLQQNAAKIKDLKIHGETPVELQDMLEQISGDLNKFDMAFVSNDNRSLILNIKADAPTLPPPIGAGLPEGIGGRANPFLTASFILVLVVVMTELMKQQSQQKLVEKKLDIMAQNWGFELAVRAADEIMKSAKTEAMMHYLLAASAGAQLGMAAANGAVGAGMMVKSIRTQNRNIDAAKKKLNDLKESPPPTSGRKSVDKKAQAKHDEEVKAAQHEYDDKKSGKWTSIGNNFQTMMFPMITLQNMTEQGAKMYENMVQGILKVEKARHDAALKILEGYQDIARRISQTSSESFKEMQQNIDSEADFMTKIIDKNYQTFAFRIH